MDDVSRRVIATSNSFSRPRKTSSGSVLTSKGRSTTKRQKGASPLLTEVATTRAGSGGAEGGGGKLSSSKEQFLQASVKDQWLGRKGSSSIPISSRSGAVSASTSVSAPLVSPSAPLAPSPSPSASSSTHDQGGQRGQHRSRQKHLSQAAVKENSWVRNHAVIKSIAAARVKGRIGHSFGSFAEEAESIMKKSSRGRASGGGGGGSSGNSLNVVANGLIDRRRSASSKRTSERKNSSRRGSFQEEKKKDKDEEATSPAAPEPNSLADLAAKIQALKGFSDAVTGDKDEVPPSPSDVPLPDTPDLEKIVNVFSGGAMNKKTFKDFVRDEIQREPTDLDKMIAKTKIIAAFGRRNFDKDEICPEGEEEEDKEPLDDDEELKLKVKTAKARYLKMFEKKETEEEKEKRELEEKKVDPRAAGLWDNVTSMKALPTLMKVKKEWLPPDWDKIIADLKAEGRDVASIDADLKDICHGEKEVARTRTGKYLMQDDMAWCRKHARFKEKDLLKWFRRFREKCPKGNMNHEEFKELFKFAFPLADVEAVSEIVFEVFDTDNEDALDFKEFLVAIDAVNCKEFTEKFRWALGLWDQKNRHAVDFYGMKMVIKLLDQVEENGFMNGPTDDELDDLMYRRKIDPPKLVEDRASDVFQLYPNNSDGTVDFDELLKTSERVMMARE